MPDKDKEKVEVRTFNWGPCLIHLQIKDDFKKIFNMLYYKTNKGKN